MARKQKTVPLDNGKNGRQADGRFVKGHTCSQGPRNSPLRAQAQALKRALLESVTIEDIRAIAKKLAEKAKTGDIPATKEVLDRCLGKAEQSLNVDGDLAFRLVLGEPKTAEDGQTDSDGA